MKNKENTLGANKQMAFLNTTKLAVLSATLLLAVFCTIGMSFTPAEEGENIGNPNDSTYITGPRRGHWGSGCNPHNNTDYAIATAITKGYGTVTLSSGSETKTSGDTSGDEVSITWKCTGYSDSHTPKFTFSATPSNGYKFDGWSIDGNTIIPSKGNPFEETITMSGYDTENNTSYESPTNTSAKRTYYAHFSEKQTATITFGIPVNGKYTYKLTDAEGDGEEVSLSTTPCPTLKTKDEITLTATPDEGIKFFGWYKGSDSPENYLSYSTTFQRAFSEDITINAKFIEENTTIWLIKETKKHYYDLSEAIGACGNETRTIVLISDGVVPAGNCTIPSNVTLLIPYDEAYEVNGTSPTTVTADASPKDPSLYRKLTLEGGVNIVVEGGGSICVNAKILSGNTTAKNVCGRVTGGYGLINMMSESSITLSSGAKLYCWGYIIGEGTIEAKSGANVYEPFQLADFRGGTASFKFFDANSCHKVFPYSQYYVQNIEVPITLYAGAKETLFSGFITTKLTGNGNDETTFAPNFIGSDGLFNITEGTFTKYYDKDEDRLVCTVNGTLEMKKLTITITYASIKYPISSEAYVFPITNNLTININSGTTTVNAEAAFLAGTRTYIAKDATLKLTKPAYIYDRDNWVSGQYVYGGSGNQSYFRPLHYSGSGGTSIKTKRTDANLLDAVIDVNGTLIATDFLYTTAGTGTEPNLGGADICSSEGTGIIQLTKGAGAETKTYQATQPSEINFIEIPITAAQLHNREEWYKDKEDEFKKEYLATAEVSTSTTIQYANNHWGWMEIWKDHNGTILKINNTCLQTNNASAHTPTVPEGYINFIGWSTEINETNQEVIHTAHYSFGPELDIVDADNTKKTLTINANGWASSGWPYTINNTEYGKDNKAGKEKYRQADRTLVIPHTGTSGASLPIAVLDKDGKPICRHIYKVPFVYTSDDTLSDTDENSENRIVFVKSGTLSIDGTASAKEIYVAPGAELEVTGILTVGKLVLRTTPWQSAVLTNSGTINGQVYYSRISPDSKQYYQFGLPLSCNLANVKMSNTDKLGGSQPKYGTAWMLKSYSESSRAEKGIMEDGANWTLLKNIDNTGTITAGVGYEMFSNSNYYREFYFPVTLPTTATSVQVTATTGKEGAAHAGWNIICSPYVGTYTNNIKDVATAIKVCWLQADGTYKQELPTVIPPAIPFSYQASQTGILTFDTNLTFVAQAPRKQSAAEALTETEWVHLDIFDAYGDGDETSLFVHPTRFEQTYKTGIDVAKQSLTAARPIIYSTHAYGDMAFAGIADSLLENGIDLVVYSPAAQELTFSLRENKFLNRLEYLWLADNETGTRTDLLMDEYTCRANAGTIKGRFVLNGRFKAPQISTGIDNTQTDYNIYAIGNNIAISGVEQGTPIYVFDAVGHMIYTTSATSDEVIVPAPCAGVYMLTIGGQTAKLVINQ